MADADIGRIFENLGRELGNVSAVVGTQSISQVIPAYTGSPSEFKLWIKNIEKYGMLTGLTDDKLKLVAYQSSRNEISDFICRYLSENQAGTWDDFKAELTVRFAEIQDPMHAFTLLRTIKQHTSESCQLYAERLLSLAQQAFEGCDQNLQLIERQLIGFFIDGLQHDYLKMKVMRL